MSKRYKIGYVSGSQSSAAVFNNGNEMEHILDVVNELNSLRDALTEAHRVILHELDSGRTPYLLPVANGGKGFGYLEDVLSGVKR
jgi:IMP cyclohydrolase